MCPDILCKSRLNMLKVFRFCLIISNINSVILNLKYDDKGVCASKTTGKPICCFEYRLHNGSCVSCPIGFIMAGDNCTPCTSNWYGDKCLRKCTCFAEQRSVISWASRTHRARCDCLFGSMDYKTREYVTQMITNSNETDDEMEINKPTTTKNINYEILGTEIVIYSVVVTCIFVIIILSYLVVKYRQKTKIKLDISNAMQNIHLNRRHSLINDNLGIYDEIDENLMVENLNINMMNSNDRNIEEEIQNNTDNTSYLNPVHSADDSSSALVSVNNSYLSIQDSDNYKRSDESNRDDDTTSYLHPYHTIDEDWKEKTHQYDVMHVLNKDADNSSDSSTQMINDGYLHPYQPLKEGWKQLSHSYEAPVKCLKIPFPSNKEPKKIANIDKDERQTIKDDHNIYPSLSFKEDKTEVSQNCHQTILIKNSSTKTKLKHPIHNDNCVCIVTSICASKQEVDDALDFTDTISTSSNEEMMDISMCKENNLEIPNKLKNISTLFVKIDSSPRASNQSERNTNVYDYTDAKSQ